MRVVVVGGTGNVGTAVVETLAADPAVTSILGLARRVPERRIDKTEWGAADVRVDDLEPLLWGADAVIHLAWAFQPMRRPLETWRTNVTGTARVLKAVAAESVPVFVYASSVGAYAPRRDARPVTESWSTDGWPAAGYTREKAYVERMLDSFVQSRPACRVVRMRPGFIFQRGAASAQRRLFAGPLLPNRLVRAGLVPFVPAPPGLMFQAVHSRDVAEAFRLALVRDVAGPFNLAADPVVDAHVLGELLSARPIPIPAALLRTAVAAAWHLRLIPVDPQLLDAFLRLPLMDATRARTELGWNPRHSSTDALRELLDGLHDAAGLDTPPLARKAGGPLRVREFTSGMGGSDPVDREPMRRMDYRQEDIGSEHSLVTTATPSRPASAEPESPRGLGGMDL
ncbi:NAD-dependent epimerase/dehydratase family protein [Nocardia huaxiensis]|uniref:NAD-dependent epimerase/dehydratase family protein n=1 Tax=Nocardia huaxiensis TaxID=2755382 RepID=A0A7D6ZSB6_9NOCA|nr:NAD-dependent epimerase/dehydratase family protein [Nocardia huaxiensis]QLY32685.1 NAD-dependent epimerase/dehydratase family protein [Nocardia huaxiensis]UFS93580.1 NAD-dependent epimerase/dehydratase family protein [Nocardia huaxiensis]